MVFLGLQNRIYHCVTNKGVVTFVCVGYGGGEIGEGGGHKRGAGKAVTKCDNISDKGVLYYYDAKFKFSRIYTLNNYLTFLGSL